MAFRMSMVLIYNLKCYREHSRHALLNDYKANFQRIYNRRCKRNA